MKRWILLLLAVLLLAGCGKKEGADTSHVTTYPETSQESLPQLYEPESQTEKDTSGALCTYRLPEAVTRLCRAGGGVGLVGEETLTVIQGEKGAVTGTYDRTESLICTADGAVFGYDPQTRVLSYLGSGTQGKTGWTLPEDTQGIPLVSRIREEIYYCVPGQILALHMQTGITRRVLEHTQAQLELMNLCFEDAVLGIKIEDSARYIRTDNGQSVCADEGLMSLETEADAYFAGYQEGAQTAWIFGTPEQTAQQLRIPETYMQPALSMNGVLSWDEEASLYLYDLSTGCRSAAISLPEMPLSVLAEGSRVWILGEKTLYRWDPTLSPVSEQTVYTAPMYTALAPDTEGLALCQERVEQLNQTYGVRIAIWEKALEVPGEHTLTGEFQVPQIESLLDQLEPLLSQFPDRFLRTTVKTGWVHLNLVRSIDEGQPFVQYWAQGDCYIALTPGCDVAEAFYTGLGWGVDSHILGNSRDLEYWNDLNPAGFDYDYDYEKNALRDDTYLSEGSRYFVDRRAMSFPTEDRARTFYFALTEGNQELFSVPVLQKKLRLLCEGIREAYDLKKFPEALPWETYLEEPLYPQD